MTRGFVTIATGDEHYFIIARNLLWSYQQFCSKKYPFAIICDRPNQYTDEFDDVILLKKAHGSYMDKLQLYEYLPYDETIFIDADSLAYSDLDKWWNIFAGGDEFSCFGYAWEDLNCGRGWFSSDKLHEYVDKVSYIPDFNGGMYYIRKGNVSKNVFQLAGYFAEHYHDYSFNGFVDPADEPCLALAMAVCQCRPIDVLDGGMAFAPKRKQIDLDIGMGKAYYTRNEKSAYNVALIHWSNYKTKQALYKFEVEKLRAIQEKKTDGWVHYILYHWKIRYFVLLYNNILAFSERVHRKIKKVLAQYLRKIRR